MYRICIVSLGLYRDTYRIAAKCIVTPLVANAHFIVYGYGDRICRPINHNKGYTKNYGNPTRGNKLCDLERSLLHRPSILPFVHMYDENMILNLTCSCFHFNGKSYFLEVRDLLLFSETVQGGDGARERSRTSYHRHWT